MKPIRLQKFDWKRRDGTEIGHNEEEWGIKDLEEIDHNEEELSIKDLKKTIVIESYTVLGFE